jgi:glucose-6-phosphate 1-dehydrogenase
MEVRDVNMDFAYGGSFTEASPEAYERLILDVLLGDPPLFPRHEEVELSWQILDPILESQPDRTHRHQLVGDRRRIRTRASARRQPDDGHGDDPRRRGRRGRLV